MITEKIPKIVLTFDDGREDNYYNVKNVLIQYELQATFNITTKYIDKTIEKKLSPCENKSMSIEHVKEFSLINNFEIAAHGASHENNIQDWECCIKQLKNWLGKEYFKNGIGIASPNCNITKSQIAEYVDTLKKMNVKYIRTGLSNKENIVNKLLLKLSLYINSGRLYYCAVKDSFQELDNSFVVYSIPVMSKNTFEQVKYIIDKCVYSKKSCVLMFHSILKNNEQYYNSMWTWDYEEFIKLCEYLSSLKRSNRICNETLINCI